MRANVDVGATSRGVGAVEVERAGDVGGDAGGGEETRGGTGARGVGGGAVEKTAREGGGDVGVGGVGWRDVEVGGRELLAEDGRRLSAALSRLCSGRPNHVRLYEEPDAAHDWLLLPWFDVTPGSAARGMDAMVHFIVEMCALHGERPLSQALP